MEAAPETPIIEPVSRESSAEDLLVARDQMKMIAGAVDRLPDRQRMVFMLRHFADHTPAQVGATLGLSEATVRVHLFRAIRRLRTLLER
jgi:RNA polymerase sigma-70 factor (ECF subfamily)